MFSLTMNEQCFKFLFFPLFSGQFMSLDANLPVVVT